ncbi:MAG: UDP-N-acetylmuramoyl-L-alanyl-D-glutamate--2,6-diaminopimelate ligase [Patescibacteria group bacterium]|nr:UDP-N-acetylmuramoyl-L-alanyl-D-glutamate--2,6-diaminopimelate ligase [Patescibacteria group bacterium]
MVMENFIKKIIPSFLIDWYHFLLAFFGALIYRFPGRKLKVVGVTGTKGKSTVVELASKILEEANFKVASLSSIKFKIKDKEWKNELKMTMPGRFKLQKFLREAVKAGCQYVVLEVTSEGILQHRHRFIDFEAAVFTNLSPEHIERHGSFEKYRQAKGKLFKQCKKVHIINLDDKNTEYFLEFEAEKKFGLTSGRPTSQEGLIIEAKDIQESPNGIGFEVENTKFKLNLFGKFNISNSLAAICVGLSQGVDLETCKKALEKVKGVEGRIEIVIEKPFKVIVDYAHTPDSLAKVYQTIRNSKFEIRNSKLICVLGACGGGRDKWKRPEMGKIAAKYCDEIILTNEDPYDEKPSEILEDIEKGILEIKNLELNKNLELKIKNYQKILDRREAIREALQLARPNDIVIITGKGSEPWMCVAGGKKIPWDDREVVREQLRKLKIKS